MENFNYSMNLEEFENYENETDKEFKIDTPELANWAIEKIKEEEANFDFYAKSVETKIDMLKMELATEKRKSEGRTSFFKYKLSEYLETPNLPVKKTATQSKLKLASGEVIVKFPKKSIISMDSKKINDSAKLLEWCKANDTEHIKVAESVDWGNLKKNLTIMDDKVVFNDTGEVVECLTVDLEPQKIEVK